jgi:hypothetical protein
MQTVNKLSDRIIRAATNQMLANTWQETEYCLDMCCATNSPHVDIYLAHKKLYEVWCLKKYQFFPIQFAVEDYTFYFIAI